MGNKSTNELKYTISKDLNYINFLTIKNSSNCNLMDNTICVFKSIDDINYLIYSTPKQSIVSFNINTKQKINEIKNAHKNCILNFRHCLDKKNNRDLILSIAENEKDIKVWDIKSVECILILKDVNKSYLFSSCFLNDSNQIYIVSSFYYDYWSKNNTDTIKIFDLSGKLIKEIADSKNDQICFIDTYNDKNSNQIYIITGNENYVRSFNYKENKKYQKYACNNNINHVSLLIYDKGEIIKLIDSCSDGKIRIWNFHTGKIIEKINVSFESYRALFGLCLLNENKLFVGSSDTKIYLIDLENRLIDNLKAHKSSVLAIKIINCQNYGEILISHGNDNTIKFWQLSS